MELRTTLFHFSQKSSFLSNITSWLNNGQESFIWEKSLGSSTNSISTNAGYELFPAKNSFILIIYGSLICSHLGLFGWVLSLCGWLIGWEISLIFSHSVKYLPGFALIKPLIFSCLSIFLVVIRLPLIKIFSKDWSAPLIFLTRSRWVFRMSLLSL